MNKTENGTGRLGKIRRLIASSVIISGLDRFAALIYKQLTSGIVGGIFTSYELENAAVAGSASAAGIGKLAIGERFLSPAKRKIAHGIENSAILKWIGGLLSGMLQSSMKSWGIFMFSFALYSTIFNLFKVFLFGEGDEEINWGLVLTLVFMLIASVMMIASRHTLASALATSPTASFVLFHVVGIRREKLEDLEEHEGKFNVAFIAGLLLGALSVVFHPLLLLCVIIGLAAAYLVLQSPEFGVLAILTALPFAPTMGLVAAVLFVSACYFFKVMCGKRSVRFDLLDGVIFVFMLLMIGGGVIAASGESLKPMLVYVAFMVGYFLVVNLIRSKEWLIRCIIGVITSCTLVSFYGLFQNFFGLTSTTWQDSTMFSDISGRVVSTFENPNVLAEYLIMVIPLIFVMFLLTTNPKHRLAFAISGLACGGCLIYTWSRGAWLGFLIGMLIFLLMYSRHAMTVCLVGVVGVPFLPFVLPASITQRFLSIGNLGDSSTSYRVNIWRGVLDMLGDYWHSGVGIGEPSFRKIYPLYALSAIEAAPHSHNLYLQIMVEIGVVGLLVFLAAMFIYAQSCFTLHASETRSEMLLSTAVFAGMLSVLAQGMTDYIWYNYRVFLMFWLMLGLGAAIRRVLCESAADNVY